MVIVDVDVGEFEMKVGEGYLTKSVTKVLMIAQNNLLDLVYAVDLKIKHIQLIGRYYL